MRLLCPGLGVTPAPCRPQRIPRQDARMSTVEHWISGRSTSGTPLGTAPVWNPATGEQQAEVVLGSPADVDEAVRAATEAALDWAEASLSRRAKVLFAFRELVAE